MNDINLIQLSTGLLSKDETSERTVRNFILQPWDFKPYYILTMSFKNLNK